MSGNGTVTVLPAQLRALGPIYVMGKCQYLRSALFSLPTRALFARNATDLFRPRARR